MRALILGFVGLACMVALMAETATPAASQPRGHTSANRGEEAGYRYRQQGYGYRPYYGPTPTTVPTTTRTTILTTISPTTGRALVSRLGF